MRSSKSVTSGAADSTNSKQDNRSGFGNGADVCGCVVERGRRLERGAKDKIGGEKAELLDSAKVQLPASKLARVS